MNRIPGVLPRYQQIKDFICQAIKDKTYPADTQIPPETELATKFNVSRMTANRAIKELVAAGLLSRHQGLGTFVTNIQAQSPLLEVRNIAEEVRDRHHVYSNELCRLQEVQADELLAARLGISKGEPAFQSLIVHKENGQTIQLEDRYPTGDPGADHQQQHQAGGRGGGADADLASVRRVDVAKGLEDAQEHGRGMLAVGALQPGAHQGTRERSPAAS